MTPVAASVTLASSLALSHLAQRDESGSVVRFLPEATDTRQPFQLVLRGSLCRHRNVPARTRRCRQADVVSFSTASGIERAVMAGHAGSWLVARPVAIDHPGRDGSPFTSRDREMRGQR